MRRRNQPAPLSPPSAKRVGARSADSRPWSAICVDRIAGGWRL